MISRGCTCLRRPLSAALDTIAAGPDEPLLFLYPRWAASAVRRRRPISSLTRASVASKNGKNASFPPHADVRSTASTFAPTCRHASRWISNDTISTQLDGDSYVKLPGGHADDVIQDNNEGKDPENVLDSQTASQSVSALEDPTASSTTKLSGVCARATKKPKDPASEESDLWPLTPGSRNRVPRGLWERNLSPRNRKQVRYGEFTLERQKSEGKLITNPKSWMDLRDMLLKAQRQSKNTTRRGTKYKELFIPEETIALLSGATTPGKAMEENIWHLPVRHGCLVHVLPPEKGNGLCRKVVLVGSEGTLELVEDSIKRQQDLQASGDPLVEVQKAPVPIVASIQKLRQLNRPVPLIRGTWTTPSDDQEPVYMSILLGGGPSFASVKEFADHVEDVVNSQPRNPFKAAREDERSDIPYAGRAATYLSRLFSRDSNRKFFSTAALNSALRYLYKYERLSVARTVFSEAEHLATVDSYNILLQSAALRQDRRMFEFFLEAMAQRRIRPNAGTWLALLQGMLTQKTKAMIIKDMAKKGYMKDINAIRSALQSTISDSFFVHLESGRDVHSFFDLMIKTHGADWFTASLLSQMFNVTSRLKNRVAMQELLDICIEYHLDMNSACLMQVLDMVEDDIFTALEYTFKIMKRLSFTLEGHALEKLFFIAYKGCHYNICRVLWHYACMEDAGTHHMRAVVLDSLVRNVSLRTSSDDVRKIWHVCAGKVIIRRNSRAKFRISQEHLDQLPPEFHHNPFLYLVSGYKAGPDRALQLQLAKAYMHRDILTEAFPKYSLPLMLEAAATMDQEWAGKPWPLAWMLQNSIGIPTTRKFEGLQ
ncbi:uncharacterized protein N7496_001828 [Penicillium cataractarum]|uniref:Uncharacterized protein n=1 Tax=Penicillium cataractarum TaxID=2100454 RepID=A0A9W9VX05_9EURO|nr:uncharacterized protein N7496_001828 [Penicillium cataractarum]KAJ5390760.1 hypothetical protein N7496_001828 [Penicillium cataractarum]